MPKSRALLSIPVIAFLATTAVSLPLVAGLFGWLHPAFDSLAHFRVHLAVLLIVASLPLLAGPLRRQGFLAIALGIGALATVGGLPGLGPVHASFQPKDEASAVYRLLQMNVYYRNAEPEKLISLIGRLQPDVITLEEVSPMWIEKLSLLSAAYPHQVTCGKRSYGVAILSRRPLKESVDCSYRGALAAAIVDFGGRHVQVAAMHLRWPWPFSQHRQIEDMQQTLGTFGETAILAGDLNATPWSNAARRVAEAGDLTQIGPLGPTWLPGGLPEALRFAGLPIDQVFAKGDVVVHSARALDEAGSDHLPILVEFSLKAAETEAMTAMR
jgi:endonuclease/exonuclease/phosphatase (EEP) superfamily protein YafD